MSAATDDGRTDDDAPLTLPLGRERVVVSVEETRGVAARVSLRTRSEHVAVSELLRDESVEIERVPVGRIVAEPPLTRTEDGVTIIPVIEEVLVRQFRVIEEVRITTRVSRTEHAETVTLRRQEARIDEAP